MSPRKKIEPIEVAEEEHEGRSLFEKKLLERGFSEVEVLQVMLVMSEVCNICWDEPAGSATCFKEE